MPNTESRRFGDFGALTAPRTKLSAEAVLLTGLVGFAALIRFVGIGSQALWLDEGFTWKAVSGSFADVLRSVRATESTPPVYYWLEWLVVQVVGTSEASLRFLSGVAGTLTVVAVWFAARRLVNSFAGLAAGAFVACSPFMWWYSQEARAYALAGLLCAVCVAGFAARLHGGGWSELAVWSGASALAIGTQYSAVAVVFATFVVLVVVDRTRIRQTLLAACGPLAAGVLLLPLALAQDVEGRTSWIQTFRLVERIELILSGFWANTLFSTEGPALIGAAVGMAIVIVTFVALGFNALIQHRRSVAVMGAVLALASVALLVILTAGGDRIMLRYWIVIWPLAAVAAGAVIGALPSRVLRIAVVAGPSVVMLTVIAITATNPNHQKVNWRDLAEALRVSPPRGRVIVLQGYTSDLPLAYYLRGITTVGPIESSNPSEVAVVSMAPSSFAFKTSPPAITWLGNYPSASTARTGQFTISKFLNPGASATAITGAAIGFALRETAKHGVYLRQSGSSAGSR